MNLSESNAILLFFQGKRSAAKAYAARKRHIPPMRYYQACRVKKNSVALENAYQELIIKQERLDKCLQSNLRLRTDLKIIDIETLGEMQLLLSDSEGEETDSDAADGAGADNAVSADRLKDAGFSGQCSYILLVIQIKFHHRRSHRLRLLDYWQRGYISNFRYLFSLTQGQPCEGIFIQGRANGNFCECC